ncbi:hypothetical protein C2E20_5205 [Micractinium conductrix]|uniref:MYND-type domain-containing protein n=1 Tax=Micractinium conductrix TaxID=554055 RepID=A0A2P6VB00_9CHLO|nr:hypothetical protein C2E20_5205 [Micractinium conductrix]|eukprot:PSC71263.1 hypothetical protein C2E20_5205 [Micractinium conductrix]
MSLPGLPNGRGPSLSASEIAEALQRAHALVAQENPLQALRVVAEALQAAGLERQAGESITRVQQALAAGSATASAANELAGLLSLVSLQGVPPPGQPQMHDQHLQPAVQQQQWQHIQGQQRQQHQEQQQPGGPAGMEVEGGGGPGRPPDEPRRLGQLAAAEEGSSFMCSACGGLVAVERQAAHVQLCGSFDEPSAAGERPRDWLAAAVKGAAAVEAGGAAAAAPGGSAPRSPDQLRAAAVGMQHALLAAGCCEEVAEALLVQRPGLLLLDPGQDAAPKLAALAAAAAGVPEDRQDPLVRWGRSSAELLCEAAAWPEVLAGSDDDFRAGLGLVLQLVVAARGSGGGVAAAAAGASPAHPHPHPHPQPSTWEVLMEISAPHVGALLQAGSAAAGETYRALQAYLGWPAPAAARALLGCAPRPADVQQLLSGQAPTGLPPGLGLDELADAAWLARRARPAGGSVRAPARCPLRPGSLAHTTPARIAQVAAWLGNLGLPRSATAALTLGSLRDWARRDLAFLQRGTERWAHAAEVPPSAGSRLAAHFARLARERAAAEHLAQLAVGTLAFGVLPTALARRGAAAFGSGSGTALYVHADTVRMAKAASKMGQLACESHSGPPPARFVSQLHVLLDRSAEATAALLRRNGDPTTSLLAHVVSQCFNVFILLLSPGVITLPEDAWVRLLYMAVLHLDILPPWLKHFCDEVREAERTGTPLPPLALELASSQLRGAVAGVMFLLRCGWDGAYEAPPRALAVLRAHRAPAARQAFGLGRSRGVRNKCRPAVVGSSGCPLAGIVDIFSRLMTPAAPREVEAAAVASRSLQSAVAGLAARCLSLPEAERAAVAADNADRCWLLTRLLVLVTMPSLSTGSGGDGASGGAAAALQPGRLAAVHMLPALLYPLSAAVTAAVMCKGLANVHRLLAQEAAQHTPSEEESAAAGARRRPGPEAQQLALARARALALRTSCGNPRCAALTGAGEAGARGKLCSGCCTVRFCSDVCSRADWRAHKPACRQLSTARAAAAAQEEGCTRS